MDKLTEAANADQCSKMAYIKQMINLWNSSVSETRLTLIVETTEWYTGDDGEITGMKTTARGAD